MVQSMNSGKNSAAVKLELDDSLADQLGPLHKRSKLKQVIFNFVRSNFYFLI